MISGSTTLVQRNRLFKSFASDSSMRVLLLTLESGSVGINLTAANHVFLLEPAFNPAFEAQAIARAWRLGQKKAVYVIRMYVPSSIEQRLIERNRKLLLHGVKPSGPSSSSSSSASSSSSSSSSSSVVASALMYEQQFYQNNNTGAKRKRGAANTTQIGSITGDRLKLRGDEFNALFDNNFVKGPTGSG